MTQPGCTVMVYSFLPLAGESAAETLHALDQLLCVYIHTHTHCYRLMAVHIYMVTTVHTESIPYYYKIVDSVRSPGWFPALDVVGSNTTWEGN